MMQPGRCTHHNAGGPKGHQRPLGCRFFFSCLMSLPQRCMQDGGHHDKTLPPPPHFAPGGGFFKFMLMPSPSPT
ncbi:hypothetical protein L208DRAFT_256984 [Tricholoma matsutake]|nr:hypothetical protein L208DRAFT_256984 [Tricholoma matsutake 945]